MYWSAIKNLCHDKPRAVRHVQVGRLAHAMRPLGSEYWFFREFSADSPIWHDKILPTLCFINLHNHALKNNSSELYQRLAARGHHPGPPRGFVKGRLGHRLAVLLPQRAVGSGQIEEDKIA